MQPMGSRIPSQGAMHGGGLVPGQVQSYSYGGQTPPPQTYNAASQVSRTKTRSTCTFLIVTDYACATSWAEHAKQSDGVSYQGRKDTTSATGEVSGTASSVVLSRVVR